MNIHLPVILVFAREAAFWTIAVTMWDINIWMGYCIRLVVWDAVGYTTYNRLVQTGIIHHICISYVCARVVHANTLVEIFMGL